MQEIIVRVGVERIVIRGGRGDNNNRCVES